MKKLISVATLAIALCGLVLTGCASSGSKGSTGSGIPHPREYVFDVIDGGASELNLIFNQYGPNYQVTPFFTNLVKKDKPQAGDTVTFKMKAVSDVDLPLLLVYPCSTSPSWVGLDAGDNDQRVFAKDVKAGEAFECEISFVLTAKMGGDFALCMQYDNEDQEVKTGGPCKLQLERICESTDTVKEAAASGAPAAPKNLNVEIEKYAAFCEIATNHPWINGVQDMSVISNYQANPDFTNAFGDDLPVAGETVHVSWSGVSDADIAKLYMRPVDCSAAANWWKELIDFQDGEEGIVFAENIKAGEPFFFEKDFTLKYDPVAQFNLCIWYDYDAETNGPGPCFIKLVKRADAN